MIGKKLSVVQNIPADKPQSLSDAEWKFILDRDKRRCWRWDQCQDAPCSLHLDCDHKQPKRHGGDDSYVNIRLACDDWNRRNGIYRDRIDEPDEYWSKPNWWDGPFVPGKLREIQRLAGYDAVLGDPHGVPANFRNQLLKTVTLLPGFTGIGKTILTVSVLFAVNKAVGLGRPRHKHVLVFEPHRTLRNLVAAEWRDDPFEFELVQTHPIVHIRTSYADLIKGPMGADVTVCCPQSLWEIERSGGKFRTEEEVRNVLALYDTFVFDECDSANTRIRRICELSSHGMKYWMTASPPVGDSDFLKSCVLINSEAIADYKRASSLDHCLKLLASSIVPAASYGGAEFLDRGVRVDDDNAIVGRDHAAFLAAIKTAVVGADNLEREMQREEPNDWYSPHIIVRLEAIREITNLVRDLPIELGKLRAAGLLHGDGWNVSAVYDGSPGVNLSEKIGDRHLHPFMVAKDNRGKATKKSARILLMSNIGTRGINNWPLLYVVDLTTYATFAETLQFIFGRPVRLPNHLAHWYADENRGRFIRTVISSLKDLLTDGDGERAKTIAFDATHKFVNDQLDIMRSAGFLTWDNVAEGKTSASVDINFKPGQLPFSADDKLGVLVGIGKALADGPIDQQTLERIAAGITPAATGRRLEQITEYAVSVFNNKSVREREIPLEMARDLSAERVVARLKPRDNYDLDDLLRFIESDESYSVARGQFRDALIRNEFTTMFSVGKDLNTLQRNLYRESPTTLRLNKDVLRPLARELIERLKKYNELADGDEGAVYEKINGAAKRLFRVDNAKDNGPMDVNPYHIAILGKHRGAIIKAAMGSLIRDGLCPDLARVANLP